MKTSVSLIALMLMAACSAAASPSVAVAPSVAPAITEAVAPSAPASVAAPSLAQAHVTRASAPVAAQRTNAVNAVVSCDVRARPTANGVLIQAVARADRAFDGEYELVITKSGGDGSADVMQSGPVSVAAGDSVTLGSTELSAGRYRAVLTLSDGSGEVCRLERRS
ncbi:MAG: curli-like amyloid fiber formation chaperone CsgH [Vitreimonas sp.]